MSQRAVENREKMEKTGCKIICGAPTTLAVKGLMMMMIVLPAQRRMTDKTPNKYESQDEALRI